MPRYNPYLDASDSMQGVANTIGQMIAQQRQLPYMRAKAEAEARLMQEQIALEVARRQQMQMQLEQAPERFEWERKQAEVDRKYKRQAARSERQQARNFKASAMRTEQETELGPIHNIPRNAIGYNPKTKESVYGLQEANPGQSIFAVGPNEQGALTNSPVFDAPYAPHYQQGQNFGSVYGPALEGYYSAPPVQGTTMPDWQKVDPITQIVINHMLQSMTNSPVGSVQAPTATPLTNAINAQLFPGAAQTNAAPRIRRFNPATGKIE